MSVRLYASVQMRKNTDQKNSEYGRFSRRGCQRFTPQKPFLKGVNVEKL